MMNKIAAIGIGLLTYLVSDIRFTSPGADQYCVVITTQGLSASKQILAIECNAVKNFVVDIRLHQGS